MPKINWLSFAIGAAFVWIGLPLLQMLLGRFRSSE